MFYARNTRLHPNIPLQDLDQGLAANIADPAWFLTRQWLLGEHQAEDAGTPVAVICNWRSQPISPLPGRSLDPRRVPIEAIVEKQADGTWPPGIRLRTGLSYAKATGLTVPPPATENITINGQSFPRSKLICKDLPEPYAHHNGAWDGRALFRTLKDQNKTHPAFNAVVEDGIDTWVPQRLQFERTFSVGDAQVNLPEHYGGHIDWHSVDLKTVPTTGESKTEAFLPTRFHWHGAPAARWWEIEQTSVDVGAFGPDRGHPATLLLLDLLTAHSDDWFTFPFPARSGELIVLDSAIVRDAFDQTWPIQASQETVMFDTHRPSSDALQALSVWTTVENPLRGESVEEVAVVIDHDSDLVWWIEEKLNGISLSPKPVSGTEPTPTNRGPMDAEAPARKRYRPIGGLREHWHPYRLSEGNTARRVVQGRLADLDQRSVRWLPAAQAKTAQPDSNGVLHALESPLLLGHGLRIQSRWVLARGTDGTPHLWVERQRHSLSLSPSNPLRFDVAVDAPYAAKLR
ncbi:MAG: hypothetical protein AAFZ17_00685 [Cyanobacteria bacterium J06650_10]